MNLGGVCLLTAPTLQFFPWHRAHTFTRVHIHKHTGINTHTQTHTCMHMHSASATLQSASPTPLLLLLQTSEGPSSGQAFHSTHDLTSGLFTLAINKTLVLYLALAPCPALPSHAQPIRPNNPLPLKQPAQILMLAPANHLNSQVSPSLCMCIPVCTMILGCISQSLHFSFFDTENWLAGKALGNLLLPKPLIGELQTHTAMP